MFFLFIYREQVLTLMKNVVGPLLKMLNDPLLRFGSSLTLLDFTIMS